MTEYTPAFVTVTKTATADTTFKLTGTNLWLEFADIFVLTNSAYFGSRRAQDIPIYANDIYTIPYPVNVGDLYFKNYTAGSNTVIIISGTILTKGKATEYGISLPP